jgi:exonuclease SbcC
MEQAGLKAKLEEQSKYREKLEEKIAKSRQLAIELDDYKTLVELFGKKGIQAVIIENAVPQIEASANRILGKLSNYQMHLGLLTQERNNSGKLEETLEIIIADTFGSRPYELYSGGEAFKIDFSLRIALSQLLACRQGRRLETLIVDEGFGSQDVDSRHRLVKAIQSVEDDFARILVVTHMQEIKEMFETQIQVEKLEGRSIVSCQY